MMTDYSIWDITVQGSRMIVGGCDVAAQAERFGTPLFVVNEGRLRNVCRRLVATVGNCIPESAVFYSYKTNSIPGIVQIIMEEKIGAEVVSDFELQLAQSLKVPPGKIIFDGIYKTDSLLEQLIKLGIKLIHIDDADEIEVLERLAAKYNKQIDVGVRVHVESGWGKNPFGIDADDCVSVFRRIQKTKFLSAAGLLVHSSTGAVDARDHLEKAARLLEVAGRIKQALGIEIKYLDVGGGYGSQSVRRLSPFEYLFNYRFGLRLKPPRMHAFVPFGQTIETLSREIKAWSSRQRGIAPRLHVQPGTALVETSQFLLTRVVNIKKIKGEDILVTDSGSVNMARPLHSTYHEVFVVNRLLEPLRKMYAIVGRLCGPGDWMYKKKMLPKVERGDLLAIMDTGAYFNAFSNSMAFPKPPIIALHGSRARLLRCGEDFNYLNLLDR